MSATRRPGGRTAETRRKVFAATSALLVEQPLAQISMGAIAERAEVAVTSLYRRWGDVRALILEVATDRLMRDRPLPDTGSLSGDLTTWARAIAAGLRRPADSVFFQAFVNTASPSGNEAGWQARAMRGRIDQVAALLERARSRGETPPTLTDVLDHLLAPLYMRALFGTPADAALATRFVERLLTEARPVDQPAKRRS